MNPNTIMNGEFKTSFSGADIVAVIGNNIVGTLQAISYSVTREKGPVYTMNGRPDPISFARGKRAIAGTLIFLTIDKQAFLSHMKEHAQSQFYANKASIRYAYGDADNAFGLFVESITNANFDIDDIVFSEISGGQAGHEREWRTPWYADQVLPFDVNLSATNEYGQAMKKSFIGVEILNEGGGISIDDLVVEESYTYIARGMTPWTKVELNAPNSTLNPGVMV